MSYIIYPQYDNRLAVLHPADCGLTIEEIAAKDVPEGRPFSIVESLSIADDFFDAYEYADGEAVFIIEKGREIQRAAFREARKPLFAALDIAFMKAVEQGDSASMASISEQKKALRDVTLTDISGETPDEIRAAWPEILGERP
jgi:hypothetical protein